MNLLINQQQSWTTEKKDVKSKNPTPHRPSKQRRFESKKEKLDEIAITSQYSLFEQLDFGWLVSGGVQQVCL